MAADPCLSLLHDLVAIDSVNPSLVPGAAGEREIAAFVADAMRRAGLDVSVREVLPGRPNVVGVLESRNAGPTLMLCGHLDTVGTAGMDDPFRPREVGGRLYGRGAQDMKGGVAAMIDAARVTAARGLPRGRLVVAAVVDEEFASAGADALVTEWTADYAIVTEPTDLAIGVTHKGFAWLEVETVGRAAHGSRPADGRDAILAMGRLLVGLQALDRDLQQRPAHPLLGVASLHASLISGGQEWSSYPARCQLQMERRILPSEKVDPAAELAHVVATVSAADPACQAESRLVLARPPYEFPAGHALLGTMRMHVEGLGWEPQTVGMSFWTDAAVLGAAGIPALLFGPGGAGLHGAEEYVRLGEVIACREVLVRLAADLPSP